MRVNIRNATIDDLDSIHKLESICFSEREAASRISFSKRLRVFPAHFWLMEDQGKVVGYINGMVTDNDTIRDEMFENADLHQKDGSWQSVFGLAIDPDYRKEGHAGRLIKHFVQVAKSQNRKGVTLTCKESLIPFYERLGFCNAGISASALGGAVWYDMKIQF